MHGYGVFLWPSQLQYSGSWQQHKQSGHGYETHKDNNEAMYLGQWNAGKRHGLGTRKRSDGRVWSGRFSEGKKDKRSAMGELAPEIQDVQKVALDNNALALDAEDKAESLATEQAAALYFRKLSDAISEDELKSVFLE